MDRCAAALIGAVFVGTCLAIAPLSASAQKLEGDNFRTTDRNDDGVLDAQEYRLRMVDVFYFADQDKDGRLTVGELEMIEDLDISSFRAADRNGDGSLTVQEFVEFRMLNFEDADANRDGNLTAAEVDAWNSGGGTATR